jgi:hypothetical protein
MWSINSPPFVITEGLLSCSQWPRCELVISRRSCMDSYDFHSLQLPLLHGLSLLAHSCQTRVSLTWRFTCIIRSRYTSCYTQACLFQWSFYYIIYYFQTINTFYTVYHWMPFLNIMASILNFSRDVELGHSNSCMFVTRCLLCALQVSQKLRFCLEQSSVLYPNLVRGLDTATTR